MVGLSSGVARAEPHSGYQNPSLSIPSPTRTCRVPPSYLAAHNNTVPVRPGCGDAPENPTVLDSARLKLEIRVPTNAKSLSFRFKFYSAEYPVYFCEEYNDFFLVQLTSGAAGIPADKNISFDNTPSKNPISVNNALFEVCDDIAGNDCTEPTAELEGTGFEGHGATTWLTTTAPVVPGEIITLEFMIWDLSDGKFNSSVLIDDFQWGLQDAMVGTNPG